MPVIPFKGKLLAVRKILVDSYETLRSVFGGLDLRAHPVELGPRPVGLGKSLLEEGRNRAKGGGRNHSQLPVITVRVTNKDALARVAVIGNGPSGLGIIYFSRVNRSA